MTETLSNIYPEQYMAAVEAAEIGVWDYELQSGLMMLSGTCRKLFGINHLEIVTFKDLLQNIHPEDVPSYRQRLQQSLDPYLQIPYDDEYRIIDKHTGNVLRWVRSKGKVTFDAEQRPLRFNGILTDISHRKVVEQKLQQSNNEFRLLADSLPQVVWTARADGFVDYWNKRWYELTGNQGEGNESWTHVVHPDDASRVMKAWEHSIATGVSYKIEARIFDKQRQEYRWFLGLAFPVKDQDGKIIKWFGTNTDIHEHKTIASLLEQKVTERTAQLERSNRELEQFAYIASHDLQEPLRKIRTFISIMEEHAGTVSIEQFQTYMGRIKSSSQRMSNLITDLLNLSRTTQSEGKWQSVDLNSIVKQVCEDLELMIEQKGAQISIDPLPEIHGIPLQFSQLFYNLIQNALKFSRPGVSPVVQISSCLLQKDTLVLYPHLNQGQAYACITVQDNGIGFEPEHAEKIFVMFQRLQGKSAYEGTGIGLALCKKVVENHQGRIEATSTPGQGTTITVYLPCSTRSSGGVGQAT